MNKVFDLYPNGVIGLNTEKPTLTYYSPSEKKGDGCVVIFAGGGYCQRCHHEDEAYAEFLNSNGITAFIVGYRVMPSRFPDELMDARVAVRYVRKNAEMFGINPNKIAVMGSSAGGNLAALVSTYKGKLQDEEKTLNYDVDFIPNAQILCYPVIDCDNRENDQGSEGSYENLLGDLVCDREKYYPSRNVDSSTPKAFIFHNSDDTCVNVMSSYSYASALRKNKIPVEIHIFPYGEHGGGLYAHDNYIGRWKYFLIDWLKYIEYIK